MFPCISGLCVEYQSYCEFHDLGAHKISASLDLCANSYGPNIVPRPAEKQTDREAEIAFFDHLNYRFSFGVEYQSCSMINYLSSVKIWAHFDKQSASYGFSCNEQRCCPCCYHTHSSSTFPRLPFCTLGKSYITILMKEFDVPDGGSDTRQP